MANQAYVGRLVSPAGVTLWECSHLHDQEHDAGDCAADNMDKAALINVVAVLPFNATVTQTAADPRVKSS